MYPKKAMTTPMVSSIHLRMLLYGRFLTLFCPLSTSIVHSSSGPQPLVDYPNEDEDTDDELPKGENGERSSLGISLKMESGQVSASAKLDEDEGIVEDQSATSNAEEGQASPPDQKRRRVKEEEESERGT